MWKLKLILFIVAVSNDGSKGLSDKNKFDWYSTASPEEIRNKKIELTKLYMNRSVDPCDDFYEYSCGNFENIELPPYRSVYNVLERNIYDTLKEFMETPCEDCDHNEQALKIFYTSCMNTDLISKRGNQPALDFLQKLNGWPMIDSKSSDEYVDWLELSAQLALHGQSFIVSALFEEVDNTTQEDVFRLMPSHHYSQHNDDILWKNVTTLLFGETLSTSIFDEIKSFEEAFYNTTNNTNKYHSDASTITLEELLIEETVIDWEKYLSILLQKPINGSQKIKVSVNSLKEISPLLSNTPSRIIANYILYKAMIHMVYPLLIDNSLYYPRDGYCISTTKTYFQKILSKMFIEKYLNESAKNHVIEISEEILEAFSKFIGNISWIDEPTKQMAQKKANGIQMQVGPTAKDLEIISDYPELKLDQYFENIMKICKHKFKTEFMTLGTINEVLVQTDMYGYYEEVNTTAFIMYLLVGMLQPPFYNQYFPKWSNYGGIGYEIGYDITVGYTQSINERNDTTAWWWSPESFKEYWNRTLCYKQQNNRTRYAGLATNGGLKFSYEAYKQWLSYAENSDENDLSPVLNLTGQQLFFVSFVQRYCSFHPGPVFHFSALLINSAEFAKEFQCPTGSAMNPAIKCRF